MEREHRIDIRNIAHFRHVYDSEQPDMRRLYEQAKIDQWNAATDIDWVGAARQRRRADRRRPRRYPRHAGSGTGCRRRSGSSSTAASRAGGSRP